MDCSGMVYSAVCVYYMIVGRRCGLSRRLDRADMLWTYDDGQYPAAPLHGPSLIWYRMVASLDTARLCVECRG